MKCTPQNAITSSDAAAALIERPSESPVVGDVLDLGQLVVVGQDHGAALAGERAHLVLHGRDVVELEQRHVGISRRRRSRLGAEWVRAPMET